MDRKELCKTIGNKNVRFGLKAQGHLPTIEKMIKNGNTWEEIGKKIGWCPKTAKKHYDRIKQQNRG